MYNFLLVLHVIIAVSVIGVILVQRGRSGGLVEALGGVESIFGTKTSAFFVKVTVVLAILFFVTSISVAYVGKQKGRSLIDKYDRSSNQKQDVSSSVAVDIPSQDTPLEAQAEGISETEASPQNKSE
ncbi:MAG: preprotein translocase subunit SecG [Candidatus Omnitrophota bacterium]|nr:preprotein translocase subunit SecG [Candidatus Omnitrophota bacterium]